MKKIVVVNDLSGLGKCSLTAALPVISAMGAQAVPLVTAVLSNQTGYPSYYCDHVADRLARIAAEWKKCGFAPDGIYTGFLAGVNQAKEVLTFLDDFSGEDTQVLVDPIMGDRGQAFGMYSEDLRAVYEQLAMRATVITPNLTEALLLAYGKEGMEDRFRTMGRQEMEELAALLQKQYRLRTVVITGIEGQDHSKACRSEIGNLLYQGGQPSWFFSEKFGGSYSGTGDLFASVLIAGLVRGIPADECILCAIHFLAQAIRDTVLAGTDRNEGVAFEPYLHTLWKLGKDRYPV